MARFSRLRSVRLSCLTSALLVSVAAAPLGAQTTLGKVLEEQSGVNRSSQRSQVRISQLADQTSELLGDYRVTTQQLDRVRIYNDNLQTLVEDQEEEKASITRQLEEFGDVEQGIVPLMLEMIADLRAFIELDMPFQLRERMDRVARLEDNMSRSDLTVSEKYRQIMEAYKEEARFGRNIESYPGTIAIDGVDTTVTFLRVGRILLAYQTADKSRTGFWNKQTGQWEELDSSYRRPITDGIAIAKKQAAPQLLTLPVPAPEQE
ncbi:MAG: DUF3450 domain-containing protein [Gammaproteobacteria bacterium]